MRHFIDRRLNPKDKSLGNRQRFLRRARAQIKKAVNDSLQERSISDVGDKERISIPSKGIGEPRFRLNPGTGRSERIFPGNKEFVPGDQIPRPPDGAGGGKKASADGEGEDDFSFDLSREEFLDLFFEDLELPDLVKTNLRDITSFKPKRAGYTTSGSASNLNILRTMRNSHGRRLALKRPRRAEVEDLGREIEFLRNLADRDAATCRRLAELEAKLVGLERRRSRIAFIDPMDVRYNRFEPHPQPKTNAVMFCLMDVSGSMGQYEKDLAKRFYVLLHLFLKRRYERIDIVFIRHTHTAQEVDEDTFFHSRETGGTMVSTALVEMKKIIHERYPAKDWNIYGAQASDGDNLDSDMKACLALLAGELLPLTQYFAYIEILGEQELLRMISSSGGKTLWRGYQKLCPEWENFAMKQISKPGDIYPVFRELFAKQTNSGSR